MNITMLQRKDNIDIKIINNDNIHLYIINGNIDNELISVTSFVKLKFPEFDRSQIINNMINNINNNNNENKMTEDEIAKQRSLIEQSFDEKQKNGKDIHERIDNYLKSRFCSKHLKLNLKEDQYFINFLRYHDNLTYVISEFVIFDLDIKIAGTIDALFISENELILFLG
jgi:hypothetical protein